MSPEPASAADADVKTCCARLYESEAATLLLGDSFHPGGVTLTARLGELLDLGPSSRVMDVASGRGTSALFLAERFGCEVVGLDYGEQNVAEANEKARAAGLEARLRFVRGDAEALEFDAGSFDALICECAFCTLPDKPAAAREFLRVLKAGGRFGLSDLTRSAQLPSELRSLLAWVACVADARPVDGYVSLLKEAGFRVEAVEAHDEALAETVETIRTRLLGFELLTGLGAVAAAGVDVAEARTMARVAAASIRERKLGYCLVVGRRP